MVRLDSILSSWKSVREDTAQAVEDFAPYKLDFKPCADLMTFGDTARHILDAGYGLSGLLLAGEEDLSTPQFRENIGKLVAELPKTEDAAALARELRSAMERRAPELAAKPAEFYAGEIIRMDGQRVTRLEMLQLIKEHELTHRQQLFMYLRLNGVVPPTTRRRQAKAKA
jgi:uncharacterized damage-inducible protein DinB